MSEHETVHEHELADAAEILALLGVRPVWQPENRRLTGVEVVPLAELGRPRIDVTTRISGFSAMPSHSSSN